MLKFKKGDSVRVTTGKSKGVEGEVMQVFPKKLKLIVKGANIYKRAIKPTQNKPGGIVPIERPLHFAKVTLLEGGKAVRAGFKLSKSGKTRISKKSGESL